MRLTKVVVMTALGAVSTSAVSAAPVCPRDAEPIPAELRAWSSRTKVTTATGGAGPEVIVGRAYDVSLHPDGQLKLPNLPGPVKDRVGRGGTTHFKVVSAGIYHVALGSGVWVDVVRDGNALQSFAHGHGPACSGIAKIVDFELTPGTYTLTLDGSETESSSIMIAAASARPIEG